MIAIDKYERHTSVWLASLVYYLHAGGCVGGGGFRGEGDSVDGICVCGEHGSATICLSRTDTYYYYGVVGWLTLFVLCIMVVI